jgi:hypothetical protein
MPLKRPYILSTGEGYYFFLTDVRMFGLSTKILSVMPSIDITCMYKVCDKTATIILFPMRGES